MADFGISLNMKALKRQFLDRQQIMNAFDKAALRSLKQVGALTRTIARRSMRKGGRRATYAQFDSGLKKLITQMRNERGQFRSTDELDIAPWPRIGGPAGGPPRFRSTRLLKDKIFFIADLKNRSVIIGPQIWQTFAGGGSDIPGLVEFGGNSGEPKREWVRIWDHGQRKIRLVAKGGPAVRLKPRPYMAPAYDKALDLLLPGMYRNSIK